MSLFKTRDWWSTTCGDDEVFDQGCLKLSNINDNHEKKDLIIVGSYNGFLRVYNPSVAKDKNGNINNTFKAHDLIIEKAFPAPILQVETGRFISLLNIPKTVKNDFYLSSSTSTKLHLAILFPRKLVLGEVVGITGNVDHGNQYTLRIVSEHNLQRSAFNMCKGAFGGTSPNAEPHEYICVQSMDATLSIFEYESFSLQCFLPNALLPGVLKYIRKTDSFLTCSSAWQIESYSYRILATNKDSQQHGQSSTDLKKANKIQPDWVYNIGEAVLDIDVVNHANSSCTILIMGERNLFCLSETLVLKFMKKFDYNPSAFCAYPVRDNAISFLITTHSKLLFVHEEVRVKWAAQFDHVPVQVAVGTMHDLKGVIVTLSEKGRLCCSYLGTEPAFSNPIVTPDEGSFDFKNAENEYKMLQAKIKDAILNTGTLIVPDGKTTSRTASASTKNKANGTCLSIGVQIPNKLDTVSRSADLPFYDADTVPSITVKIKLRSSEPIKNLKLNIVSQLPVTAVPETISYASLTSTAVEFDVVFHVKSKHCASSLNVQVLANFNCMNDTTKVQDTKFTLPLRLVAKPAVQTTAMSKKQHATCKLIFDTNKSCVSLAEIFPEFSETYTAANGNSIGFQFYGNGSSICIQSAKSSNRYRLQSESYASLWLAACELTKRLTSYFAQTKDFALSYQDPLPIDEYKQLIEKHLEIRLLSEKYKEMLEQCSVQFRAIQKRLLSKFKDKTPTSLDNLDAILEATYRQITTLADRYEANEQELYLVAQSLCCFTSLYIMLMGISQSLTREEIEILEYVLIPKVIDTPDLGWEETVNASMATLLRTTLSKTGKQVDQIPSQLELKIPTDVTKLEKHIKSLYEKIEKGAVLVPGAERKKSFTQSSKFDVNSSFSDSSELVQTPRSTDDNQQAKSKIKSLSTDLPSYDDLVSSRSAKSGKIRNDLQAEIDRLDGDL